jgi:hypothetical protein
VNNRVNHDFGLVFPPILDLLDLIYLLVIYYVFQLDIKSRDHQVWLKEEKIWKTSFKSKQCLFEWLVMSFRLCNTLATFMRLIDEVVKPFLDTFVVVLLDAIFMFSKTLE